MRAPKHDGAALVEPSVANAAELAATHYAELGKPSLTIADTHLAELRLAARSELLAAVTAHLARQCAWLGISDSETPSLLSAGPIILSGHQPVLAHGGVWFKNFVLDAVARRSEGIPLALIIDNDLVRSPSVRVPAGTFSEPRWDSVAYDESIDSMPWEDREIVHRATFRDFGNRLAAAMRPFGIDPLYSARWPIAQKIAASEPHIGAIFACLRQRIEWEWGLKVLDVPLSRMCETASFRRLLLHILLDLPAFQVAYNQSLEEFRLVHRTRSPAQPLPNLTREGDWLETPAWIWLRSSPRRRPLFVRRRGGVLELSDQAGWLTSLEFGGNRSLDPLVLQLELLTKQGVRIRPRALLTTLFARLLLGDLFIHGIGGAKYDQVTDALFLRYFGMAPPPMLVATATFHLPRDRSDESLADPAIYQQKLRELAFHPETFLKENQLCEPQTAAALADKRTLLAELPLCGGRSSWRRRLVAVNQTLAAAAEESRLSLQADHAQAVAQRHRHEIFDTRDFASALFPESFFKKALLEIHTKLA